MIYTVTVVNNGMADATSLVISNAFPAELQFVSKSSSDYNEGSGVWTIGGLAYSASTNLQVTATVKASAQGSVVTIGAGVQSVTETDPDSSNDAEQGTLPVRGEVAQSAFAHRLKIEFPGYAKSETLTNFPALVVLNESLSDFDYDLFQSLGADLRFVSSNGTTVLYHEFETWNTSGDSHLWVQLDEMKQGQYIWPTGAIPA